MSWYGGDSWQNSRDDWQGRGKGKGKQDAKGYGKSSKGTSALPAINIYVGDGRNPTPATTWPPGPSAPQPPHASQPEWQHEQLAHVYMHHGGNLVVGLASSIGSAGASLTTAAAVTLANVMTRAISSGFDAAF